MRCFQEGFSRDGEDPAKRLLAGREAPALHKPNAPGGQIYGRRNYLARYLLNWSVRVDTS